MAALLKITRLVKIHCSAVCSCLSLQPRFSFCLKNTWYWHLKSVIDSALNPLLTCCADFLAEVLFSGPTPSLVVTELSFLKLPGFGTLCFMWSSVLVSCLPSPSSCLFLRSQALKNSNLGGFVCFHILNDMFTTAIKGKTTEIFLLLYQDLTVPETCVARKLWELSQDFFSSKMSTALLLQLWCFIPFSKISQMLVECCIVLNKSSTTILL